MPVLLVTGGYDFTIKFWDASSGACYKTLQHPEKQVNCLAISPDKQYVVAGGSPHVKLYDVNAKGHDPLVSYEGHTGNVTSVGFQRDGKWMYTSSEDGTIKIWDPRVQGPQRDYESRAGVNCVALHPNQGELISGDHLGTVRVWDLTANRWVSELVPEIETPISSVAVSPDAALMCAANYSGAVYFWSPRTAEEYTPVKRLACHKAYVLNARFSPDARLLATSSSDRTVKLWSTSDFSLAGSLGGHTRWVWDAAFSADSSYLVSCSSDMSARLWDVTSGEVVRSFGGHHKAVTAVALNDAF
jgi:G protein beta subunit-like protein